MATTLCSTTNYPFSSHLAPITKIVGSYLPNYIITEICQKLAILVQSVSIILNEQPDTNPEWEKICQEQTACRSEKEAIRLKLIPLTKELANLEKQSTSLTKLVEALSIVLSNQDDAEMQYRIKTQYNTRLTELQAMTPTLKQKQTEMKTLQSNQEEVDRRASTAQALSDDYRRRMGHNHYKALLVDYNKKGGLIIGFLNYLVDTINEYKAYYYQQEEQKKKAEQLETTTTELQKLEKEIYSLTKQISELHNKINYEGQYNLRSQVDELLSKKSIYAEQLKQLRPTVNTLRGTNNERIGHKIYDRLSDYTMSTLKTTHQQQEYTLMNHFKSFGQMYRASCPICGQPDPNSLDVAYIYGKSIDMSSVSMPSKLKYNHTTHEHSTTRTDSHWGCDSTEVICPNKSKTVKSSGWY